MIPGPRPGDVHLCYRIATRSRSTVRPTMAIENAIQPRLCGGDTLTRRDSFASRNKQVVTGRIPINLQDTFVPFDSEPIIRISSQAPMNFSHYAFLACDVLDRVSYFRSFTCFVRHVFSIYGAHNLVHPVRRNDTERSSLIFLSSPGPHGGEYDKSPDEG